MNLKVFATTLVTGLAFSAVAQADLSQCYNDDAVCTGKVLIRKLNRESGGEVNARRLIRRMQNQCDTYNSRCASRFVSRAINQAFGGHGGGGHQPGGTYTVVQNEISNSNTTRTAWCEPGDVRLSANCEGKYNSSWGQLNGPVERGRGRRKEMGYKCNNHAKNLNKYRAVVTCRRR